MFPREHFVSFAVEAYGLDGMWFQEVGVTTHTKNPKVTLENFLQLEKLNVWYALCFGDVIGPDFFSKLAP